MRTLLKSLTSLALASIATLALAGAANASSSNSVSDGGHLRGTSTFTSDGEVLKVYDKYGDGKSVMAVFSLEGYGSSWCTNSAGASTTPKTCNLSGPEGGYMNYWTCYGTSSGGYISDPVKCSAITKDKA